VLTWAVHAVLPPLPALQKFNAMIYLPFREDARIVHMHGCAACLPAHQGLGLLAMQLVHPAGLLGVAAPCWQLRA